MARIPDGKPGPESTQEVPESGSDREARRRSAWVSWVMIAIVLAVVLALEYFLSSWFHPGT